MSWSSIFGTGGGGNSSYLPLTGGTITGNTKFYGNGTLIVLNSNGADNANNAYLFSSNNAQLHLSHGHWQAANTNEMVSASNVAFITISNKSKIEFTVGTGQTPGTNLNFTGSILTPLLINTTAVSIITNLRVTNNASFSSNASFLGQGYMLVFNKDSADNANNAYIFQGSGGGFNISRGLHQNTSGSNIVNDVTAGWFNVSNTGISFNFANGQTSNTALNTTGVSTTTLTINMASITSNVTFLPSSNTIALGNTTARWVLNANTGNFSGDVAVSGSITQVSLVINNNIYTVANTTAYTISADPLATITTGGYLQLWGSSSTNPGLVVLGNSSRTLIVNATVLSLNSSNTYVSSSMTIVGNTSISGTLGVVGTLMANNDLLLYKASINRIYYTTELRLVKDGVGDSLTIDTNRNATFANAVTIPTTLDVTGIITGSGSVGLNLSYQSGSQGSAIRLNKPSTGTSIAGPVTFDINSNNLRIYETGGSFRGVFLNLTACGSQSQLWHDGNDGPGSGLDADTVDGYSPVVSTVSGTPNAIVLRDSNGDTFSRYVHGRYHYSLDDVSTGSISYMMAKFGDDYYRSATATKVKDFLALQTSSNVEFNSFGVGTAGSGTTGEIRATSTITAGYSDDRMKTRLYNISNALEKLCGLNGFYFRPNDVAQELGYKNILDVGVSAQEVNAILPEVVAPAPIDSQYMTVRYEKLIPLIIEAIKELRAEIRHT